MENLDAFYNRLVYFVDCCFVLVLWSFITHIIPYFGIFCGILLYYPLFWYVALRKIWQPCAKLLNELLKLREALKSRWDRP
jgi:hypothetical protein